MRAPIRAARDLAKAPHRGDGGVAALFVEQPRRHHVAPDRAQRLFVEQRHRTARQAVVNDETDRVRADVDHGERRFA